MKAVLIKIQVLSLLWVLVLPAWANDVGLHHSSAQPTRTTNAKPNNSYKTLGVCIPVSNGDDYSKSILNSSDVPYVGTLAFEDGDPAIYNLDIPNQYSQNVVNAKTELLQEPKYGTITFKPNDHFFTYSPKAGYKGNDKAVFLVTYDETHKVKVNFYLKTINGVGSLKKDYFDANGGVVEGVVESIYKKYCGQPNVWKISTIPNSTARVGWAE